MKKAIGFLFMGVAVWTLAVQTPVFALSPAVSPEQAHQAADNWLSFFISNKGAWGDAQSASLKPVMVFSEGFDTLGYYFEIDPKGYILCPASRELPPITAYSTSHGLILNDPNSFGGMLQDVLRGKMQFISSLNGDLNRYAQEGIDTTEVKECISAWDLFASDHSRFSQEVARFGNDPLDDVGPLLETEWHQNGPYWQMCPSIPGDTCLVGCVATAAAQIMKYHNWPPSGTESNSYWWTGDPPIPAQTLSADFSDSYDWGNILNSYQGSPTQAQIDAVAELCHEIGIAFSMDYGSPPDSSSGAITADALTVYPTFFRYSTQIDSENRVDYPSGRAWFEMMQEELNADRPMQYRIRYHSIVCDGWRIVLLFWRKVHMNYGWADGNNNWYTVDHLFQIPRQHPMGTPRDEYLIRHIMPAGEQVSGEVSGTWPANSTYFVTAEINIPANQTLTIEPGVQVIFQGHYKFIVNSGATLQAVGTEQDSIIFTAANPTTGWWGIRFLSASSNSQVKYCNITHGKAYGSGVDSYGGGIYCNNSNITIQNCKIEQCSAFLGGGIYCYNSNTIKNNTICNNSAIGYPFAYGGGIYCYHSNSTIINNLIYLNSAGHRGGGICIDYDAPQLVNNTIVSNTAAATISGGAIVYGSSAQPTVQNCIIWGNSLPAIYGTTGSISITYSNVQQGWPGTGNINADPLFVTGPFGEYYLSQTAAGQSVNSPCVNAGDPSSPMITGTTRTDGVQDAGIVDMGYHYPLGTGELVASGSSAQQEIIYNSSFIIHNSPNPFNAQTAISFQLSANSFVGLRIYDTAGRLVTILVNGWRQSGTHEVTFDGSDLPSGIYVYRLEASGSGTTPTTMSGKMILLK